MISENGKIFTELTPELDETATFFFNHFKIDILNNGNYTIHSKY